MQELGYINAEQVNAALAYQKEHRDLRLGQALQKLGFVNERQVLEALGRRLSLQIAGGRRQPRACPARPLRHRGGAARRARAGRAAGRT